MSMHIHSRPFHHFREREEWRERIDGEKETEVRKMEESEEEDDVTAT